MELVNLCRCSVHHTWSRNVSLPLGFGDLHRLSQYILSPGLQQYSRYNADLTLNKLNLARALKRTPQDDEDRKEEKSFIKACLSDRVSLHGHRESKNRKTIKRK